MARDDGPRKRLNTRRSAQARGATQRREARRSGSSAHSRGAHARRLQAQSRRRAVTRSAGAARSAAQRRLKKFRQGSLLAVSITGLFLLLWGVPDAAPAQEAGSAVADSVVVSDTTAGPAQLDSAADTTRADPGRSVEEATSTVRRFVIDFTTLLPKILIALGLLLAAGIIVRLIRAVLRRVLGEWERADAATALTGIIIWLLAFGVALSVIAGD